MRRLALAAAIFVTACRGDAQKCEQACRNVYTLTYWQRADADIAKLPPEQRKLERQKRLSDFTNRLEMGVDTCTTQCQSANNDQQIDCMIAAKTAEQAIACAK
jgi:hypothetical protein